MSGTGLVGAVADTVAEVRVRAVAGDIANGAVELVQGNANHVVEAVLSARAEALLGGSEDSTTGDERKCVLHCEDGRCFGVGYQIVIVCGRRLDDEVGVWRVERLMDEGMDEKM